jgi:RHH-type transcriptional regulator, proline utilization regulon repressor / proline dehydrogenase / delta 1-pyrroline-5-carboxylate dehydrogenase
MATVLSTSGPMFATPYAPNDEALIRRYVAETRLDAAAEARIDARATRYIEAIRRHSGAIGGLEDFLREYSLSTPEGIALMVLAEALLRVPDAATQDRLIEDKLAGGDWGDRADHAETWLVLASTWALGLSSRLVQPGETPDSLITGLVRRVGKPAVRTATRQAMRVLGHHFVLGETIAEALRRARPLESRGFRHSYDMLGEGARTAADAERYFDAYASAIAAIGAASGSRALPDRPGISVKLSALHPRYEAVNRERALRELVPAVLDLARRAKAHDLNFTVDAEEADRLELSLDVIAATFAAPALAGWDGFGLAIQAYGKRAAEVIAWIDELAGAHGRRMMVRLVKGAYWDSEVKRAQERGLADYPVFTRKAATDQSYLACARRLLAARPRLYPQFASHNALTVATIVEMAGRPEGFEFQRLHGMGEALYDAVADDAERIPCRVYAPVGGHRELLAYLVRRLLENGANSSFVAIAGDRSVPIERLLKRPAVLLDGGRRARHGRIALPGDLYLPARRNSKGIEFGSRQDLTSLLDGMRLAGEAPIAARPLAAAASTNASSRPVVSPVDGKTIVGSVIEAPVESIDELFAAAGRGFIAWSRTPVATRAAVLDRLSDLLEAERDGLVSLLAREGGRTVNDGVAEVREAVDYCRYYAAQARRLFAEDEVLPGPTGERDLLRRRGRGVFVCISPWNFPLAIFLGQVTAALAAGNTVIAKPAEQTPLIAFRAFGLMHQAGIPVEAAQLAPGEGRLGAALVGHRRVAGVAFTGSTETAWSINRALAAKDGAIVPFIAETGGINAMIVDATALPEQVTDDVIASAFRSAGERCSALRLLCLQDDVADRILAMIEGAAMELKLGDPRDPATDLGPIIDREAKASLDAHVAAMLRAGKVRFAGKVPQAALADGYFVAPHIIALDDPGELSKEVFGPILHVVRWRADRLGALVQAIAATGYGLTLGIHSRIDETAREIVAALPVGNVYVNRNIIGAVVGTQPFGGSGLSGTGPKAGGPDYLRRFALEQVVATNTAAAGGNASLIAIEDE